MKIKLSKKRKHVLAKKLMDLIGLLTPVECGALSASHAANLLRIDGVLLRVLDDGEVVIGLSFLNPAWTLGWVAVGDSEDSPDENGDPILDDIMYFVTSKDFGDEAFELQDGELSYKDALCAISHLENLRYME